MYTRDYRDIVGGGLLVLLGLWICAHSINNFDIGTVSRMGPGMFPASLGVLLAGLGALIGLPALFRAGTMPSIDWRPMIFILLSVLAFGLTVVPFGMMPAVAVTTVVASLSDNKLGVVGTALVAVGLCIFAYLVFRLGLGVVLEPFRWPF